MTLLRRTRFETPCRIEIDNSDTACHAHVELAGNVPITAGDRVCVQGEPITVRFGQRAVIERMAVVERAGLIERLWTKFTAHFEMSELYEVSFTPGRIA
ncbi:hypothetical protein [Sphingomonas sp.]|uniref:hypothetical protein n=1 Tax=Sphingomonas sp. TaxID=28214 RepID=UPI001E178626|nr:hypothetical protein [Sphingomonas sp.]MBX9796829.1 hypothetical protein [Sphingomonas sp.]